MGALSVTADGSAPFVYQWYKDGVSVSGATARTYVIISAGATDAGSYHAVVSNDAGAARSDDAVLTVTAASNTPPGATEPGSESVAVGDKVTLAVAPTGSSYQWQRQPAGSSSWQDLQGGGTYSGTATAALTISPATAAMSGDQFRCVMAGPAGPVTSRAMTLTVGASSFQLQFPVGIARDSAGNLYVADAAANTVLKVTAAGMVSTLAGTSGAAGSQDGAGADARFNQPSGVAVDAAGNVYVADMGNATIRKITRGGAVTTLAGSAAGRGSRDGAGSDALFNQPAGLAVDNGGTVYVADAGNSTIRKITAGGAVTTLAGTAGNRGETDGNGPAARFNAPTGVAVDAGGNLYVADTYNATIRTISPDGAVTTLAGSAGITGTTDLAGRNAQFNQPAGVAVDATGTVYVADTANSTIRGIARGGAVTTLAGVAGIAGLANGSGTQALFNQPHALLVDGTGNVIVADAGNAAVRRVTPDATVSTMAFTPQGNDTPQAVSTPPPSSGTPPTPASSGGTATSSGGGGAIGGSFVAALVLLGAVRRATHGSRATA